MRWTSGRSALYEWHADIGTQFPECDQIVRRLLVRHQKRSHFFARASVFWFRLFGGLEVVMGVILPLLFIYPQTQNNVGLLATVSVLVAVFAALSAFWGWRENWGTYRAQNILLAEALATWELTLIEIISSNAPDQKKQALSKTKEVVINLFAILNQEHETYFSAVQSPEDIVATINRRSAQRSARSEVP
ncbi:SLATT domain-containing protein [Streptomyces sp. NPDC087903]|uniref:SLATT domain-containing protein n=1 Tax=Streptomyces sp. NPDC087903 TaxID=3365819 RepID=UPI0037F5005D